MVEKDVFYWEPTGQQSLKLVTRGNDYDVNDLLYRNAWMKTYNIDDHLGRIKAKTLIIHVKNDQWLRYKEAEATAKKIKGAKLVGFESPLAHYAVFRGPNMMMIEVIDFLKQLEAK
jgi:homoserine acetyltransferase